MSVNISVSTTEDVVDIIATPTVNIVNVTNSASINPGLYDLSQFTNTSVNPFVRTSGLSSYVPTSRTLTINGVTQDLTVNRTFTVSAGITIGTTAITSGTVGRVLFEGTGNVVQESADLFWDNTNGRLGIGTNIPLGILHLKETATTTRMVMDGDAGRSKIITFRTNGLQRFGLYLNNIAETGGNAGSNFALRAYNDAGSLLSTPLYIHRNSGNIGVNTTSDAGFKLDINGTARIQNQLTLGLTGIAGRVNLARSSNGTIIGGIYTVNNDLVIENLSQGILFNAIGAERMRVAPTTGNILINTITDAGFKLDVNGTARFGNVAITGGSGTVANTLQVFNGNNFGMSIWGNQNSPVIAANTAIIIGRYTVSATQGAPTTETMYVDLAGQRLSVGNGGSLSTIAASSALEIKSTDRGFLCPRMTTTQINAIATPAEGLQVYNTTIRHMCFYQNGSWVKINHSPM
jgi:hypothetical protein